MKSYYDLPNEYVEINSHGATDMITEETHRKCTKAISDGYRIRIGNAPQKRCDENCYMIAHTNSRRHGKSIRTIHAIRAK